MLNRTSRMILLVCVVGLLARPTIAAPPVPAATTARVDFETRVKPILQSRCMNCHARGKLKGGLSIETREAILKGGESGPGIVVGKSGESLLVSLVAGVEPERRMPAKGDPLSAQEIGLIRGWIDQGAKWPEGFSFGFRKASIALGKPKVPPEVPGSILESPIDRFIQAYAARNKIELKWFGTDHDDDRIDQAERTFARRASLDLVGLLPTPEDLQGFILGARPTHAEAWVLGRLDDPREYADHWLSFWNDALRNAYKGPGFIDGGRKTITPWLYQSLFDNKPYDVFVRELIDPVPGAEGFTKGIVWRGVVNASQLPPVQAAQNVSQVFLGTNLKCASCHDSFVNHWKLTDAYALASVFSEKPLELNRCDKPTGKASAVAFIYPELGTIDALAPRATRMKQLSEIMVKPENGRFARTIVNRLWAHMMGRGLIEPLDDMDQAPWDQDLLDWLAADFVEHHYDIKHTLKEICLSTAYHLNGIGAPQPSDRRPYVFRGPYIKRMTAEQFADAVSTLTGVWPKASGDMIRVDGRGQGGQIAAVRKTVGDEKLVEVRAALTFDDPLQAALGRSNREQVVTRRDGIATTLQALELTNGTTLDETLKAGAARWLARSKKDEDTDWLVILWWSALGRDPSKSERAAALELVGQPTTLEGVQDLLWSLTMLPEFQLIP